MVEPKALKRGFAGVACPENIEPAAGVAELVGVELVPGAFPVLAPKKLGVEAPLNKPPPAAPPVAELPPEAGVGDGAPNMPAVAGLLPENNPPAAGVPEGVPVEAPNAVAPPAPPNRLSAGAPLLAFDTPWPPNILPPPLG